MNTALKPVDRTAANVIRKGIRYVFKTVKRKLEGPPKPTVRTPPTLPGKPHYEDITGRKYGRVTVVRLHDYNWNRPNGKRIRWLCRCVCGNYTIAYGHKLRSAKTGPEIKCGECWETMKLTSTKKWPTDGHIHELHASDIL